MIDRARLNEHIRASGYQKQYIAQAMGISMGTLRHKLQGTSEFKLAEAQQLAFLLGLSEEEQTRCFWTLR